MEKETQNISIPRLQVKEKDGVKYIDYWLINEINSDIEQYVPFLYHLENAIAGDQITIHINSEGGSIDTANIICSKIATSPAHITVKVEGMCASAATFIMLCDVDEVVFAPYSYVMCHAATCGFYGKMNEIKSYQEFNKIHLKEIITNTYSDFLTPDEIEQLFKGEDFWFTADEAQRRILKKNELRERITKVINHISNINNARITDEINKFYNSDTKEFNINELKKLEKKYFSPKRVKKISNQGDTPEGPSDEVTEY